jgi:hypothetical protein
MNPRYEMLPAHMQEGMKRYIEQGADPGDFLKSMLRHEIYEAAGKADRINLQAIPAYIFFMCNDIPAIAHGSKEAVDTWIETKGLQGVRYG